MPDNRVLRTLRQMAWERAKGELKSILQTFWDEEEEYLELDRTFNIFIRKVESDSPLG